MDRFATARALFDEFPTLSRSAKVEIGDEHPVALVKATAAAGKLREATAICSYVLPRREAVWWVCHCIRMRPQAIPAGDQALLAAEAWAHEPSEKTRDIAAQWGKAGDQHAATTWAAAAAGFTGGNLTGNPEQVVRPTPYMTDRKSTRLNSSHLVFRMPSSA